MPTVSKLLEKLHPSHETPMSTRTTPKPLAGKVALITGASKGIGAATALELSSQGAKVVINYSSNAAPAEALVQQIGPENAVAIKANAGSVSDIERLVQETVAWSGGNIDIVIANAGVMPMRTVEQTTEEDFARVYDLNVKGPYFLVQKALPHIPKGGRIILCSTSVAAFSGAAPNYLLYASSKGAVEQMTRLLAKDLGGKGINVNCIAPGPVDTELFREGKPQQVIDMIASANPYKKIGEPEEIARAFAYLSGEGSSWVNGQILRVNGGMTIGN